MMRATLASMRGMVKPARFAQGADMTLSTRVAIVVEYELALVGDAAARRSAGLLGHPMLMFGVPATYQRLLEYKAIAGIDRLPRGKLRRLAVAGAPLVYGTSPNLYERVR